MSYSVSANGPKAEVADNLDAAFGRAYPEAAEAVDDAFSLVSNFVREFFAVVEDNGQFSVSVSGHANLGQDDYSARDSVSVSIFPVTPPAGSGG